MEDLAMRKIAVLLLTVAFVWSRSRLCCEPSNPARRRTEISPRHSKVSRYLWTTGFRQVRRKERFPSSISNFPEIGESPEEMISRLRKLKPKRWPKPNRRSTSSRARPLRTTVGPRRSALDGDGVEAEVLYGGCLRKMVPLVLGG